VAHILVVDDQTDICEVLKAGLETAPEFYVSCCNSGSEAIAILGEHQPDFAVVDVLIPGVAGVDVAKSAVEQKIPVLFMTGNPDTARELLDAQVPCIIKPFRLDYLIEQVRLQLKTSDDNLKRIHDYLAARRAPRSAP
jgi:DNA-binding response OmpR family regulator